MFAKKQPEQLRLKLATIQRDAKLGKLTSQEAHIKQVCFLFTTDIASFY